MREYPFGMLVSSQNNKPWVTHVPFVVEENENGIYLLTHISAANPQSQQLTGGQVLVVFREPHAYISPGLYNHQKNVPTWNYIAVHAYGNAELISDKEALILLQEKMIQAMEPGYMEQFKKLPGEYLDGLLKGITGIKIAITELLGKEKLSQNKMDDERKRIAEHLSASDDTTINKVGDLMKKK